MAFRRPTRDELVAEVAADTLRHLSKIGVSSVLPGGNIEALNAVVAGARHMLHAHLDYNERQLFPHLASGESLDQWADLFGLTRRAPQAATGNVLCTGTAGTEIPLGTRIVRSDQVQYRTTQALDILSGGSVSVPVEALQAGSAGNAATGTSMTFDDAIDGVDAAVTVEDPGIQDGVDTETDAQLQARLVARIQSPPMGGSVADFVSWMKSVPGVTRAWCVPNYQRVDKVLCQFATDGNDSPIPTAAKVAEVDALLQGRRPVGATVITQAPTALPVDFQVRLIPDRDDIREAVEKGLRDLLLIEAEPGGTIPLSHVGEAISTAPLEVDHILELPAEAITAALTELPIFGSVTFS